MIVSSVPILLPFQIPYYVHFINIVVSYPIYNLGTIWAHKLHQVLRYRLFQFKNIKEHYYELIGRFVTTRFYELHYFVSVVFRLLLYFSPKRSSLTAKSTTIKLNWVLWHRLLCFINIALGQNVMTTHIEKLYKFFILKEKGHIYDGGGIKNQGGTTLFIVRIHLW